MCRELLYGAGLVQGNNLNQSSVSPGLLDTAQDTGLLIRGFRETLNCFLSLY